MRLRLNSSLREVLHLVTASLPCFLQLMTPYDPFGANLFGLARSHGWFSSFAHSHSFLYCTIPMFPSAFPFGSSLMGAVMLWKVEGFGGTFPGPPSCTQTSMYLFSASLAFCIVGSS